MNRLRNVLLRRCKSLSRVGSRSSSYSNLRSMSARDLVDDEAASVVDDVATGNGAVVFVGSSRRRYVISTKHLSHPLIAALIDDDVDGPPGDGRNRPVAVNCEVVLFDHLLWMLDNAAGRRRVNCEVVLFDHLLWMLDNAADLRAGGEDDGGDAVRELAQLYAW